MLPAMRRLSTWLLILALILIAISLLWLLPRLLQKPPPPETNIVAPAPTPEPAAPLVDSGAEAKTAGGAPAEGASTVEEDSRKGTSDPGEPAEVLSASGRILGRVVDPAGHGVSGSTVLALHAHDLGTPIDEASWWITHLALDVADPVALGAEAPLRATTDEAGNFAFEDFEPGRVRLSVRSEAHDPLDRDDLWLAAGGTLALPKLRVERATILSGRIFDPDGRPILGASIVLVDDFAEAGQPPLSAAAGVRLAETNGRGYFRTIPVDVGPGSFVVSGAADLLDLVVARETARDGWEIEATLAPAGIIRGRVRRTTRLVQPMVVRAVPADPRSAAGPGIPFACRGDAREATVLPTFDFELRGLDPDIVYELRASERSRPWEVDSAWSPPVLAVAGEERADLAWDPDASVTFRIVDPVSHEALGSWAATLAGFDPETARVTGPSEATFGLSTIDGLRPRRLASFRGLRLAKGGFLPLDQGLGDIQPGRALALGDLELSPVPTMRVRVVDARTQRPIEGARVVATENPSSLDEPESRIGMPTDAAGEARIRSFGGTASEIEVRAPGYATARRQGPFGAGFTEASVEVGLLRGATVKVRVVDAAGEPVVTARIEHVEGNWSPNVSWRDGSAFEIGERPDPRKSRIADEFGVVEFRHVAPGRQAFRLQRYRGYQDSEWTLRELSEGGSTEIVIVSQSLANLEVRVTDQNVALAGAAVALLRGEDEDDPLALLDARRPLPPSLSARLDERGAASFANLAPGRFLLLVRVPGQELRAVHEVDVAEGGRRVEIDLAKRMIVGTVAHAESGPIAGAEIRLVAWDRRDTGRGSSRFVGLGYLDESEVFARGMEITATTADEYGRYRILGLPQGTRFIVSGLSGPHWKGTIGPIQLEAEGTETRADLAISPAGAIEVHLGTRAAIVPCVIVAVSWANRSLPRVSRAFSGGIEVFEGLQPGEWDILVDAAGGGSRHEYVDVVAGQTAIVEFALP